MGEEFGWRGLAASRSCCCSSSLCPQPDRFMSFAETHEMRSFGMAQNHTFMKHIIVGSVLALAVSAAFIGCTTTQDRRQLPESGPGEWS